MRLGQWLLTATRLERGRVGGRPGTPQQKRLASPFRENLQVTLKMQIGPRSFSRDVQDLSTPGAIGAPPCALAAKKGGLRLKSLSLKRSYVLRNDDSWQEQKKQHSKRNKKSATKVEQEKVTTFQLTQLTKTKTFNEGKKKKKKTIFREKGNFKKKELGVIVVDVMKNQGVWNFLARPLMKWLRKDETN